MKPTEAKRFGINLNKLESEGLIFIREDGEFIVKSHLKFLPTGFIWHFMPSPYEKCYKEYEHAITVADDNHPPYSHTESFSVHLDARSNNLTENKTVRIYLNIDGEIYTPPIDFVPTSLPKEYSKVTAQRDERIYFFHRDGSLNMRMNDLLIFLLEMEKKHINCSNITQEAKLFGFFGYTWIPGRTPDDLYPGYSVPMPLRKFVFAVKRYVKRNFSQVKDQNVFIADILVSWDLLPSFFKYVSFRNLLVRYIHWKEVQRSLRGKRNGTIIETINADADDQTSGDGKSTNVESFEYELPGNVFEKMGELNAKLLYKILFYIGFLKNYTENSESIPYFISNPQENLKVFLPRWRNHCRKFVVNRLAGKSAKRIGKNPYKSVPFSL